MGILRSTAAALAFTAAALAPTAEAQDNNRDVPAVSGFTGDDVERLADSQPTVKSNPELFTLGGGIAETAKINFSGGALSEASVKFEQQDPDWLGRAGNIATGVNIAANLTSTDFGQTILGYVPGGGSIEGVAKRFCDVGSLNDGFNLLGANACFTLEEFDYEMPDNLRHSGIEMPEGKGVMFGFTLRR